MKKFYEILFQDGNLEKEQWEQFFSFMTRYLGFLKSWKLYLKIKDHQIHFYIQTKYALQSMMNGLSFFCFQEKSFQILEPYQIGKPIVNWNGENFLDFYDKFLLKKKRKVTYIEVDFLTWSQEKFFYQAFCYYKVNNHRYRSKVFFLSPSSFFTFDLTKTSRFVYKKIPKYLNIQKYLGLFQKNDEDAFLQISTFPYSFHDSYLTLNQYDFARHSFVLGASGTGKSKFLSSFIERVYMDKNLQQKYKIIMIDPHAAMESDIGGLPDTVVIDFAETVSSLNLFASSNEDIIAQTELYLSLFSMMMQEQYNSKLERVLRFSLQLLLSIQKFTFSNLRNLLLESDYRTNLIHENDYLIQKRVQDFFLQDFYDLKTKSYGEAIAPILAFLDEMQGLPVFQQEFSGQSLYSLLNSQFLTLISLDRTKLGDHITKMISGFLMCQLLDIIGTIPFSQHLLFIVDEVAVIENPILCRFLSEARKYNLSVILVSQYFNQITQDLKDAILSNVINYYIFRISPSDADLLVDNLNISIPNADTREDKINLLTKLSHREGIIRIEKNGKLLPGMKMKTLSFRPIPRILRKKKRNFSLEQEKKLKSKFIMNASFGLKDLLKKISTSHKKVGDSFE